MNAPERRQAISSRELLKLRRAEQRRKAESDPIYGSTLSKREAQIAELLSDGFMPMEVADRLELSPNTVSTYITRAKRRMGTHSAIGVAVMWARQQWVKEVWGDYETQKKAWQEKHPAATWLEHEQAMREIAKRCGV